MAIYVDPLMDFGWSMYGRAVENCHLFTDELDLVSLHALAQKIGLKRAWFQDKKSIPHYDLTPSRRVKAVQAGAIEISWREAVTIINTRRALLKPSITNFYLELRVELE